MTASHVIKIWIIETSAFRGWRKFAASGELYQLLKPIIFWIVGVSVAEFEHVDVLVIFLCGIIKDVNP